MSPLPCAECNESAENRGGVIRCTCGKLVCNRCYHKHGHDRCGLPARALREVFRANRKTSEDGFVLLEGASYQDQRTVIGIATRGSIDRQVVSALFGLMQPQNHARAWITVTGDECAVAHNRIVKEALQRPEFAGWPFLLTIDDDVIVPPDLHVRLLKVLHDHPQAAAASALCHQKSDAGGWLALGNPAVDAVNTGFPSQVTDTGLLAVNAFGMGCALWRLDIFRQEPEPWFVTTPAQSHDIGWCLRLRATGHQLLVDCGLRVKHLDVATGRTF